MQGPVDAHFAGQNSAASTIAGQVLSLVRAGM
jgi:hypothetical protein